MKYANVYQAILLSVVCICSGCQKGETMSSPQVTTVIEPIAQRRSLYALDPEAAPLTDAECELLFTAAGRAPSSYNNQSWRFVYGRKGTRAWDDLFSLLVPFNQSWCKNGQMLVLVLSRTTFEFNGKPSRTHSFDTGAAAQNMSLQAHSMGLVSHGMEGFDYDRARQLFDIPEGYEVEAMFCIGRPAAHPEGVVDKQLLERDASPSPRKPVADIAREGVFPQ